MPGESMKLPQIYWQAKDRQETKGKRPEEKVKGTMFGAEADVERGKKNRGPHRNWLAQGSEHTRGITG